MISLLLAVALSSSLAAQDSQSQTARLDAFLAQNQEALETHSKALRSSGLFQNLAASGRLENARVSAGPPARVVFRMNMDGVEVALLYTPAQGEPPQAETLQLLLEGRTRSVGLDGLSGDKFADRFPEALRGALSAAPERAPEVHRMNGQYVNIRYEDGAPKLTHIWRGNEWVALDQARMPGGFFDNYLPIQMGPGDNKAVYAFQFGLNGDSRLTHQWVRAEDGAAGWIQLQGGKPLPEASLPLARRVVALQSSVDTERAAMETRRQRSLAGLGRYPRVASMAAGVLNSAQPGGITLGEIYRRAEPAKAAPEPAALPASRRSFVIVMGGAEDQARARETLARYRQTVTAEATDMATASREGDSTLSRVGRFFTESLSATNRLVPQHVTVVMAPSQQLNTGINEANAEIARMPQYAAGQGALDNAKSARGERALARPGLFGVRGRAAARRVAQNASAHYEQAAQEMEASRDNAAQHIANSLDLARARTRLETAEAIRANGIGSFDILEAQDAASEASYRSRVGRGGVAIPYKTAEGETYLLPLTIDEAALPRPGQGMRLVAAVDVALSRMDRPSRGQIEATWTAQIARIYGITPQDARAAALRVLRP